MSLVRVRAVFRVWSKIPPAALVGGEGFWRLLGVSGLDPPWLDVDRVFQLPCKPVSEKAGSGQSWPPRARGLSPHNVLAPVASPPLKATVCMWTGCCHKVSQVVVTSCGAQEKPRFGPHAASSGRSGPQPQSRLVGGVGRVWSTWAPTSVQVDRRCGSHWPTLG